MQSAITAFDIRFGRPQPKLGVAFSQATRKFTITEPYSAEEVKKEQDQEQVDEEEMIMTLEDQIALKTTEDLRGKTRAAASDLMDQKARLESQILLMKMQLIEQMIQTDKRRKEITARLAAIKSESGYE